MDVSAVSLCNGRESLSVPAVPRPPIFIRPMRANGAEKVVMFSVTLRMTVTLPGLPGTSLFMAVLADCVGRSSCDMVAVEVICGCDCSLIALRAVVW